MSSNISNFGVGGSVFPPRWGFSVFAEIRERRELLGEVGCGCIIVHITVLKVMVTSAVVEEEYNSIDGRSSSTSSRSIEL